MKSITIRWAGRALGASALLFALTITAAACSASANPHAGDPLPSVSTERHADVVVELDYAHGNAPLPIDAYDFDSSENSTRILHAIAVQTDSCMAPKGFDPISPHTDWTPGPAREDRVFGRWSVEYAEKFGVDLSPDSSQPSMDLLSYGVDFNNAYAACQEEAKEKLRPDLEFVQAKNIAGEIRWRAFDLATKSIEGKDALAAWRGCAEKAGIVLDAESHTPSLEYKKQGKEAEIEANVTYAECAKTTGAVQEIYNLRARYELALMDSQQENLIAFKKEQETVLAKFDKVIAGG